MESNAWTKKELVCFPLPVLSESWGVAQRLEYSTDKPIISDDQWMRLQGTRLQRLSYNPC